MGLRPHRLRISRVLLWISLRLFPSLIILFPRQLFYESQFIRWFYAPTYCFLCFFCMGTRCSTARRFNPFAGQCRMLLISSVSHATRFMGIRCSTARRYNIYRGPVLHALCLPFSGHSTACSPLPQLFAIARPCSGGVRHVFYIQVLAADPFSFVTPSCGGAVDGYLQWCTTFVWTSQGIYVTFDIMRVVFYGFLSVLLSSPPSCGGAVGGYPQWAHSAATDKPVGSCVFCRPNIPHGPLCKYLPPWKVVHGTRPLCPGNFVLLRPCLRVSPNSTTPLVL